jgi:hypothetical protein
MGRAIKTSWEKTAGYKTVAGAGIYLAFELFLMLFPNALSEPSEDWIGRFIDWIILTGVLDKLFRNRKEITDWLKFKKNEIRDWISNKFKKKKP